MTDDGLPAGAPVTLAWTKVSGPGSVSFANAAAASTTAKPAPPNDVHTRAAEDRLRFALGTKVRILRRAEWLEEEPGLLALHLEATAFLRNMARVIAGTLLEIGLGARPIADAGEILAGRDRTRAGRTAPALGLTLEHVYYEHQ